MGLKIEKLRDKIDVDSTSRSRSFYLVVRFASVHDAIR
jgi:hypothetical protein